MNHDMDGFWPVRPGSSKVLWNALKGPLEPGRLNGYLTAKIAVCLFTDGWAPEDWATLMGWRVQRHPGCLDRILDAYKDHDVVQAAAKANGLSMVRADGLDWLRVVLRKRPWFRGQVPLWTVRALRDLREERGCKVKDLYREPELDLGHSVAGRVAKAHQPSSGRTI